MIRPATQQLVDRPVASALTGGLAALLLVVPALLAAVGLMAGEAAGEWLSAYEPVVYLHAEASPEEAAKLAAEVDQWAEVGTVELRTPAQARAVVEARVGQTQAAELGLTDAMFPHSLVIEPATPVVDHIELIALVSGLEARAEVEAVDVPSGQAAGVLHLARWGLVLGALLFVALGAGAFWVLRGALVEIRARERDELVLLEVFGTPAARLDRASLVRGVVLGVWAGGLGAALLFVCVLLWQHYRPFVLGLDPQAPTWAWLVVVAVLLAGPLLGLVAGWSANRAFVTRDDDDGALPIDSLVRYRS